MRNEAQWLENIRQMLKQHGAWVLTVVGYNVGVSEGPELGRSFGWLDGQELGEVEGEVVSESDGLCR